MNLYKIRNKVKKIDFVQNRGSSQEQGKMNLYKISTNEFVQIKSKISYSLRHSFRYSHSNLFQFHSFFTPPRKKRICMDNPDKFLIIKKNKFVKPCVLLTPLEIFDLICTNSFVLILYKFIFPCAGLLPRFCTKSIFLTLFLILYKFIKHRTSLAQLQKYPLIYTWPQLPFPRSLYLRYHFLQLQRSLPFLWSHVFRLNSLSRQLSP